MTRLSLLDKLIQSLCNDWLSNSCGLDTVPELSELGFRDGAVVKSAHLNTHASHKLCQVLVLPVPALVKESELWTRHRVSSTTVE